MNWLQSIPVWGWAGATAFSLAVMVVSLGALRWLILRLRPDHFLESAQPSAYQQLSIRSILASVGRNVLGVLFLLAGLVMCFGPGQGLLTMLMGVAWMDFPGKRRLEVALIRRPTVHGAINKLRKHGGQPPLLIP